ncbi:MAG: diadenylate cyclase [Planctomycetota bacterium]|nr:MAG: diadenylate cyclase [Planctomycetota bacterium]
MIPLALQIRREHVQAIIEIAVLAGCIYAVLRFLRGTRGFGVLRGLAFFLVTLAVALFALSQYPGVPVLTEILRLVAPWLFLVLVILFQPELRQGISRFGTTPLTRVLPLGSRPAESRRALAEVAAAVRRMAKERIGALIAFERAVPLSPYYDSAVRIDAPVSALLLESLFFPGNPLHDGAVVIRGDTVVAAAVLLPLTENPEVQHRLGTRHRAALGLTEETDAVTMVVSEETGQITLCAGGRMYRNIPFDELETRLAELLRSRWEGPREGGGAGPPASSPADSGEHPALRGSPEEAAAP